MSQGRPGRRAFQVEGTVRAREELFEDQERVSTRGLLRIQYTVSDGPV